MADKVEEAIKARIRDVPDYPKPGIVFKDITPLLKDIPVFSMCIDELAGRLSGLDFDYVVGIEARGFIVGSALACRLGKGFVPIRKRGKLPYDKIDIEYDVEYGQDTLEIHRDSIEKGSRVVIVDDLLAKGGTALAAASLVRTLGGSVSAFAFIIELSFLKGRGRLQGSKVIALSVY